MVVAINATQQLVEAEAQRWDSEAKAKYALMTRGDEWTGDTEWAPVSSKMSRQICEGHIVKTLLEVKPQPGLEHGRTPSFGEEVGIRFWLRPDFAHEAQCEVGTRIPGVPISRAAAQALLEATMAGERIRVEVAAAHTDARQPLTFEMALDWVRVEGDVEPRFQRLERHPSRLFPTPEELQAQARPETPAEEVYTAGARQAEREREAEILAEQRAAEQRAAEQRAAEERMAEERMAEQRAAAQRMAEQRAAEQRMAEERAAAQRAAEERAAAQRAAEQSAPEEAVPYWRSQEAERLRVQSQFGGPSSASRPAYVPLAEEEQAPATAYAIPAAAPGASWKKGTGMRREIMDGAVKKELIDFRDRRGRVPSLGDSCTLLLWRAPGKAETLEVVVGEPIPRIPVSDEAVTSFMQLMKTGELVRLDFTEAVWSGPAPHGMTIEAMVDEIND